MTLKIATQTAQVQEQSALASCGGSVRSCEICGARVRNQNPKTTTCDPICTAAKHGGRTRQQQIEWEMANEQYDDCEGKPACPTCGGDGTIEYMEGGPEVWGEDCPSEMNHLVTCPNCRGSGMLKDATSC